MKEWKWPFVISFSVLVAAIVAMFGLTEDAATREHLIGYMDAIVPFVVGAAAGGTVGGITGYTKGKSGR